MKDAIINILIALIAGGELFKFVQFLIHRKDEQQGQRDKDQEITLRACKVMLRHDIIQGYDLANRRGYTTQQGAMCFYDLVACYDSILEVLGEENGYVDDTVEHFSKLPVKPSLD